MAAGAGPHPYINNKYAFQNTVKLVYKDHASGQQWSLYRSGLYMQVQYIIPSGPVKFIRSL